VDGKKITSGKGAGMKPEVGKEATLKSYGVIKDTICKNYYYNNFFIDFKNLNP